MDSINPREVSSHTLDQISKSDGTTARYTVVSTGEDEDCSSHLRHTTSEKQGKAGPSRVRTKSPWFFLGLTLAILLVSFVILIWYTARSMSQHIAADLLAPAVLGGQLSYVQAKAIDFVCSAALGPLLMVCLDYVWFRMARTTVVSERRASHGGGGVPLPSLVQASGTGSGGFDLLKLRALLSGGTWKMVLFGILVCVSGIAGKMISNLIAYQAFEAVSQTGSQAKLTILSHSSYSEFSVTDTQGGTWTESGASRLSMPQQAALANQLAAMLTNLNFQGARTSLEGDSSYIGANATTASMDVLDSHIVGLVDVPSYRLSVECQPTPIEPLFGLNILQMGEASYVIDVSVDASAGNGHELTTYAGYIPGIMTLGSSVADNDQYPFAAFSYVNSSNGDVLGILNSNNDTADPISSQYGMVQPVAYNMSSEGFLDTKSIMTLWAINCSVLQQDGVANYSRALGGPWMRGAATFHDKKSRIQSSLVNYQTSLRYSAPLSTIAGLGPALAQSASSMSHGSFGPPIDFTVYSLNYLYASAEARRITYEVMANSSASIPASYYNVTSITMMQHYRITYIPLLLVVALAMVIIAALITAVMASSAIKTTSFRSSRSVDGLRLLVDSVVGLRDSAEEMMEASMMDQKDLADWASQFKVGYSQVGNGDSVAIRMAYMQVAKADLQC